MLKKLFIISLIIHISTLLIFIKQINAAAVTGINYQGRYKDNGMYVTGSYTFKFKIYDIDNTLLWASKLVALNVDRGMFNYVLHCSTISWDLTTPFVEVSVGPEGSTEGELTVLSPREQLMGVAYSFYTSTAVYSQTTGAGTANYVTKFAATNQAGNSTIYDNGNIAIGNASPANKLDIEGNCAIGATYAGTSAGPANGLIIEGNVGIGLTNPQNKLDVEGAAAIGATYAGTSAGPSNGLIVEGKVGIGITNPTGTLEVTTGSGNTYALKISSSNGTELLSVKHNGTISGCGFIPIGTIVAWHKSFANTPALPGSWVECTGGTVSDAASPINGQAIPNLNSQVYAGSRGRYIRGGTTSGSTNASSRFSGNTVKYTSSGASFTYYGMAFGKYYDTENGDLVSYSTTDNTLGYPYVQVTAMTMVWIMRIK
ncbi:MAG: hypothetical protein WC955_00995 [Elusimicrobiota bacterium]